MDFHLELRAIAEDSDANNATKQAKYAELGTKLFEHGLLDAVQFFIDHLLSEDVQPVISRPTLEKVAQCMGDLEDDPLHSLCEYALAKIAPRRAQFEEVDAAIRKHLADVLINEEECSKAATVLAEDALLTATGRGYSDAEKAEKYVRIARLFLQDDDTVSAEVSSFMLRYHFPWLDF